MKIIRVKKVYLFFCAVAAFMIHLPFAFSGNRHFSVKAKTNSTNKEVSTSAIFSTAKMYDSLKLNFSGLSEQAFSYAGKGYDYLKLKGKIGNENILSIVDFSRPSSQKRLFIIDLKNFKVLFNTYVAHGQGSGAAMATEFSNTPESYQSSLGFYTTSSTYMGKNGYSMHLEGMEKGINDKAEERAIVMHGAPYVNEDLIHNRGYIGRSWGCPAVSPKVNKPIIDKIKNGTCLFIYSENNKYLHTSKILNS
jgi:hypothetical protein